MRSCDALWVVTKIGRAITDANVDSLLSRYGKTFKMAIVCTGSDEGIDDAIPKHLLSEGQSIGNHEALWETERKLRKRVKSLPKKISSRKAKLNGRSKSHKKQKRSMSEKTRQKLSDELDQYQQELEAAEKEYAAVSAERFSVLVDAMHMSSEIFRTQNASI